MLLNVAHNAILWKSKVFNFFNILETTLEDFITTTEIYFKIVTLMKELDLNIDHFSMEILVTMIS